MLQRSFKTDRARFLGLLVLVALLRLPSFFHPIMDIDEAEYAGVACRMLDGGLPYRDGVIVKFPGVLYIYHAVFRLFGRYNMVAVHLVTAAFGLATALVCRRIARRLAGDDAGWWAAVLYAVFSVGFYSKMQAGNCEMFAVLPAALSVLAYQEARRSARLAYFLVSGLFGGVAVLFKQPVLLLPASLALGGLVHAWKRSERLLPQLAAGAAVVLGTAGSLAILALHLYWQGILGDAVFWTWTYIWRHYFPSVQDSLLLRLLSTPVPLVLSMAPLLVLAWYSRAQESWPIAVWLASMVVAAFTGGRMFGHYFLLAVPPLCVLAGSGAVRLWSIPPRPSWLGRAVVVTTVCLALGELAGAAAWDAATDSLLWPKPDYRPAAARILAATVPEDRIFIWGRSPLLYAAGQRCPSTRFVYAHHLAGKVPGGSDPRAHSVPEGWRQLMEDLRRDPPIYVLDTSHGDYNFDYAPIENYPLLWQFIGERYDFEQEIANVRFYRRKAP